MITPYLERLEAGLRTVRATYTPDERKMSGTAIQRTIVEAAGALGWCWVHWRAARTEHGWRVPVEGTMGAGWPDVFLGNPSTGRLAAIEVKAYKDSLTQAQADVLELLEACGVEVYVIGPAAIRDPLERSPLVTILTGPRRNA